MKTRVLGKMEESKCEEATDGVSEIRKRRMRRMVD